MTRWRNDRHNSQHVEVCAATSPSRKPVAIAVNRAERWNANHRRDLDHRVSRWARDRRRTWNWSSRLRFAAALPTTRWRVVGRARAARPPPIARNPAPAVAARCAPGVRCRSECRSPRVPWRASRTPRVAVHGDAKRPATTPAVLMQAATTNQPMNQGTTLRHGTRTPVSRCVRACVIATMATTGKMKLARASLTIVACSPACGPYA